MREDGRRSKWVGRRLRSPRFGTNKKHAYLLGEKNILDMISVGAPLAAVLNNLCTAIDLQIGNIVSVMLLPNDTERDFKTIAKGALQFGLHLYWSADIPLREEDVLGSLEMYCCIPRTPTAFELKLIQRATHLAALAIRRYHGDEDLSGTCSAWKRALERQSNEATLLN